MSDPDLQRLQGELKNFGVTDHSIRWLGGSPSPDLLDYLDLVQPRRSLNLLPDLAAENQGRALLFFVNESRLSSTSSNRVDELNRLRRLLASRGDRAYLAVLRPGQLEVVPISLDEVAPEWNTYHAGTDQAATFFSRLSLGRYDGVGEPADADFVFKKMFELLTFAANRLAEGLDSSDVVSLVGRALFFRFLCDRQVITTDNAKGIHPLAGNLLASFDTAEGAAATSQWLDHTFNGDFLRLSDNGSADFFDHAGRLTNGAIFAELGAIVRGRQSNDYQLGFDWDAFDFAHVPVGLLSQVHEAFCWKWEGRDAEETSVYYTPRKIATTLVTEAFDGLANASTCRMLDPACGAGIFLTLAFRRLYRERWQTSGVRPDTEAIREILENQITGFDISDSALKLAALSLYLTAIELDPEPVPPEKLKFKELRNRVLFNWRKEDDPDHGIVIGSLGPHVGTEFDHKFDLVLSNPPWTSVPKKQGPLAKQFTILSKEIIRRRGASILAKNYENPDSAPDLPTLWRSTEWCRTGGRIAMALPARVLLKQEATPRRARETLFQLLDVTGIINGSNLSDTKVWPEMRQPFMLLFARNSPPRSQRIVQFITPYCDTVLNRLGEVRIDSKSAHTVDLESTGEEPWLFKTLSVGTSLDADVVRQMKSAGGPTLTKYWKTQLGLKSGPGYQIADSQEQKPAEFLTDLPNLNSTARFRFVVQPDELQDFGRTTAWRPREEAIYEPPLVLIKVAPGNNRERGFALLCFEKVAYCESFYGYSAAGYDDGELLVRYIHLFVHSAMWQHYALMTSAIFGAERRRFYKADLDGCPIIPIEVLTTTQRETAIALSKSLEQQDTDVFAGIDAFFGELYGLDGLGLEIIRDSLTVCLPYNEFRTRATNPPSSTQTSTFRDRIELLLRPFFRVLGKEPQIHLWNREQLVDRSPFGVLLIGESNRELPSPDLYFKEVILPLANETGATSIVQQREGGLIVGLLRQYRYWTPTRSRLLAAEILQHFSVFEG